ncbi:NADPH-dependent FMN reductase [uncultured Jatrophihabitans sp.]|uniref:NADPH-dependent FMN reductase n=1 Tax=uncultured Jatrophihabitans sp. TaxID=1610747 RepID=UPI0035C9939F
MKLLVIIASTRPSRVGKKVGDWFVGRAREHGAFDVEVADLAELRLPFLDEAAHPRLARYEHEHTKNWSASVDSAEAFVFVHPEYNHSYTAPLKNAIDFLQREWAYKPVGFVSYGGLAAGVRAVHDLKAVLATLRATPVVEGVPVPWVATMITDDGFEPTEVVAGSVKPMLDELARYAVALAPLRAAH